MAEYIERQKLFNALYDADAITARGIEIFRGFPAADVVPAKRGKWVRTTCSPHRIFCSECYSTFIWDDEVTRLKDVPHNYCPKCGAEMGESG